MRILHCADIHLDSKLNANFDSVKSRERRAELVISFKHLVDYAIDNYIDAIIIAGDLFDTGVISNATIGVVEHCIRKNPQVDFYYLRGNHDEKDVLGELNLPNLKVFGKDWTYYRPTNGERVVIAGAIEPSEAPVLNASDINIAVLHGQVYENGATDAINLTKLRHKAIDYLALGHIHKYQIAELDSRGMYFYPGCLESRGFDECDEHGVVILDIDDNGTIKRNFVKWGERQVYRINVDISECLNTFDALEKITGTLEEKRVNERDMVEIVLTGNMSELAKISLAILEGELSKQYYCVKIKDSTGIKIDLEDYTKEISLKSEFIRLVMRDSSLDEDTKKEIIRTGLLALAGEIV